MRRSLIVLLSVGALLAGACGAPTPRAAPDPNRNSTITVVTHDSFAVSDEVLAGFTEATGVTVKVLRSGDAGAALNQAILTKDRPLGDVFFGLDNTFLSRALKAGVFASYKPVRLDAVPSRFRLDPENRAIPIDHGAVCLNYDRAAFAPGAAPTDLAALTEARFEDKLVVQNPATSSPGLAFLLATVATFGEGGWQQYWRDLKANGVLITPGWEEAYTGAFSGGSGEGDRPIVVSYATSPPAEVYFADPQPQEAPTAVVTTGCFGQIEFAGVLRGAKNVAGAQAFIDFLLSTEFQEDLPLQMFVLPVVEGIALPSVFERFAARVDEPLSLSPAVIAANRDDWIKAWTEIMLR